MKKNIKKAICDLKTFSPDDLQILSNYLNVDATPLAIATELYVSRESANMDSGLAKNYMNKFHNYLAIHNYHKLLDKLPTNIHLSIKRYTEDPIAKDDPQDYANINTAIKNMPQLTEEFVVFRGQDHKDLWTNKWFSASIDQNIALNEFASISCCLLILYIQPGVRVLPLYEWGPNFYKREKEVIIEGGHYLQLIGQDITIDPELGEMPTYIYKYGGAQAPTKSTSIQMPQTQTQSQPKTQQPPKNMDTFLSFFDRNEMLEELHLLDIPITKTNVMEIIENRLTQIRDKMQLSYNFTENDAKYVFDKIFKEI